MFKTNPDSMRMEPTPERVLSVCRLVGQKSMTRDEIRAALTLGINDEKEFALIKASINVALEELALIKTQNDRLLLAVEPDVIASPSAFRRYVSARAFSAKDSTFYMFTRWLVARNHYTISPYFTLTDTSFDFFSFHIWMLYALWIKLNPARLKASNISVLLATTSSHLDSNCTS